MKLYHTETQADYDALMIELEEKGYKWLSGDKPTHFKYWSEDKEDTCITISGKDITFDSIEWHKKEYPDTPIIEYKAKGENMLNTECKQCHKKWHHDNAKYCSWCGNKLVDEPKFKVDDYVTYEGVFENKIAKIDSINEDELHGLWYEQEKEGIRQDWWLKGGHTVRHATPEEIAEYEAALMFHDRGRKPFEVKKGDLIRKPSENFTLICYPENFTKEEFLDYGWEFLKTVEEVNEWLGVSDDK